MWVRKEHRGRRKSRFHFEELWASDVEYMDIISSSQSSGNGHVDLEEVVNRLRFCADMASSWGLIKYGKL